jgi:membrane-associated protein
VAYGVIPSGLELLQNIEANFNHYFYLLILLIILLESIVYIGFYFPGQFFAVVLVVLSKPQPQDIFLLTIAMVVAATFGSIVNYWLGTRFAGKKDRDIGVSNDTGKIDSPSIKKLLLAMLHINSLAFFMFAQGAKRQSPKVVLLAGLLNLPYYLLLILATSVLSEQVMQMAENTWLLMSAISLWLAFSIFYDYKKAK